MTAAPPDEGEIRRVLSIRSFRLLWISMSLSSLGDWLGFLATTALAYQLVPSASAKLYAVAVVLFVRLVPAIFVGPFAGAFADRLNRRTTMVVTDLIRFALFLSIPLFLHLWWLFVASFLIECASQFWIPAKEASIPNLVPRNLLESANKLNLVTTYGFGAIAALVFTALSGVNRAIAHEVPFFRSNPVNLSLYFDALTFIVSAVTIVNLREISGPRSADGGVPEQVGLVKSIADGFRFLSGQRWLKGLSLGVSGAAGAGAAVIGLSRAFANDLQGGNAAYGTLFGTVFVGLASGMFLGPRLLGSFPRRRAVGLGIVGAGVTLAVDAVVPNLALAIVTTAVLGFWGGLVWVVSLTLVGSEVTDDLRGRTFAFLYNMMRLVLLLMVVLTPSVAGLIGRHELTVANSQIRLDGVTLTLFGSGVIAVVIGIVCYRLMDDRRDVPLRADIASAVRRIRPQIGRGTTTGLFVVFEGGEGAGKSTQVTRLASHLKALGHEVVVTFEPGATAIGKQLRQLLLDPANVALSPVAEAMLYAADRAQHVADVIRPALARGAVVICDRFVDSSIAYQSGGRGLPERDVRRLSTAATSGLRPDLIVLLDLPPAVGLARLTGTDRMESEAVDFHERVRRTFLTLATQRRGHYLVLDATQPVDEIAEAVRDRTAALLPHGQPAEPRSRSLADATP